MTPEGMGSVGEINLRESPTLPVHVYHDDYDDWYHPDELYHHTGGWLDRLRGQPETQGDRRFPGDARQWRFTIGDTTGTQDANYVRNWFLQHHGQEPHWVSPGKGGWMGEPENASALHLYDASANGAQQMINEYGHAHPHEQSFYVEPRMNPQEGFIYDNPHYQQIPQQGAWPMGEGEGQLPLEDAGYADWQPQPLLSRTVGFGPRLRPIKQAAVPEVQIPQVVSSPRRIGVELLPAVEFSPARAKPLRFGHSRDRSRVVKSDNYTQDTREWPDPTEPRASHPPEARGCTCKSGEKLDCPVHGMHADPLTQEMDHTWSLPENNPLGFGGLQNTPRNWTQAISKTNTSLGHDCSVVPWRLPNDSSPVNRDRRCLFGPQSIQGQASRPYQQQTVQSHPNEDQYKYRAHHIGDTKDWKGCDNAYEFLSMWSTADVDPQGHGFSDFRSARVTDNRRIAYHPFEGYRQPLLSFGHNHNDKGISVRASLCAQEEDPQQLIDQTVCSQQLVGFGADRRQGRRDVDDGDSAYHTTHELHEGVRIPQLRRAYASIQEMQGSQQPVSSAQDKQTQATAHRSSRQTSRGSKPDPLPEIRFGPRPPPRRQRTSLDHQQQTSDHSRFNTHPFVHSAHQAPHVFGQFSDMKQGFGMLPVLQHRRPLHQSRDDNTHRVNRSDERFAGFSSHSSLQFQHRPHRSHIDDKERLKGDAQTRQQSYQIDRQPHQFGYQRNIQHHTKPTQGERNVKQSHSSTLSRGFGYEA